MSFYSPIELPESKRSFLQRFHRRHECRFRGWCLHNDLFWSEFRWRNYRTQGQQTAMERVLHQYQGYQDGPINRSTGRVQQAWRAEIGERSFAMRCDDQRRRFESQFCSLISLFSSFIEYPLKRKTRNLEDSRWSRIKLTQSRSSLKKTSLYRGRTFKFSFSAPARYMQTESAKFEDLFNNCSWSSHYSRYFLRLAPFLVFLCTKKRDYLSWNKINSEEPFPPFPPI